jgi:hypothetical protein
LQQIFEQVTNNFLECITVAQHSTPTTSHDNEVTKQLVKEVVEESKGKWVDVVKKMGKQMDSFVSQGEATHAPTAHVSYDLTKQKARQHNNC